MATQIQLRRGSSTQWSSTNPILMQGEIGAELNTGRFKIGDGTGSWNSLPYSSDATTGSIDYFTIAASDETTDLTTGSGKVYFRMPYAGTLLAVRSSVNTAPVGSTLIVDINISGSAASGSLLGTKLSIDASEKTSVTAASQATIATSSLADDSEIIIDIDQVGSSTAGKGLKVYLKTRRDS